MQIIGWFHSHPHITVWPSHVDIRTQLSYQMMDKNFVGLIVSLFNKNKATNLSTTEMICFQSVSQETNQTFVQIPFKVCINKEAQLIEKTLQVFYAIPRVLTQELKQIEANSLKPKDIANKMGDFSSINSIKFKKF
jgi:BRCA1/BRCA2-containing complex subunit 3